MSDWNDVLSIEELRTEVLRLVPDAIYKSIEIYPAATEDIKFLRQVDIERAYIDLSSASPEEVKEYKHLKQRRQDRPPDKIWHFIIKREEIVLLDELSIFQAQSLCLGYSSKDEADAWGKAWGKLKVHEDMGQKGLLMIIFFAIICLSLAILEAFL